MLCGIGIKVNLKNPKVHWVIEISNVVCQLLVAIGTVFLFKNIKKYCFLVNFLDMMNKI